MYNVKNMTQPPNEPDGMADNGGQFAISRETDKAASCWAGLLLRDAIPFPLHVRQRELNPGPPTYGPTALGLSPRGRAPNSR